MANPIESFLRFNDYYVNSMEFKRNSDYKNEDDIELDFNFSAYAHISEDGKDAILSITCKIFEEEFFVDEAPFFLEMGITGHFSCEGNVNIENFQLNGMAILLPYLRSLVTSFTSQAGMNPVILPPINVYNAFKDN